MLFASGAHAAKATAAGGIGGTYWIFFLLIIAMMVWMFTQQSRQQKQRKQMQSSISAGDRVVTVGGIIGTVKEVTERGFMLEVAEGVTISVVKSAIGSRVQEGQ